MATEALEFPRVFATDLDGTLLPLEEHPDNLTALDALRKSLKERGIPVIFATGRHRDSIQRAMAEFPLPEPTWVIGDVGTSVYQVDGQRWHQERGYQDTLSERVRGIEHDRVVEALVPISGLHPQPDDQQGRFKISYFAPASDLGTVEPRIEAVLQAQDLPFRVISSIDPFSKVGLIDVLPIGVSKAFAIEWVTDRAEWKKTEVVFSGDSGNDLAVFESGYLSTVVKNAAPSVVEAVKTHAEAAGHSNRIYLSDGYATSGVWEGVQHFGLVDAVK